MAFYSITSSDEFAGATVIFGDGSTQTIASDSPNYTEVVKGLLNGSLSDDELLDLIAPFEAIYKKLTRLSERVARKGMRLYFDGDAVAHRLAQHIVNIMDGGAPEVEWQAWLKFWEKVATNPSLKSQDELFIFIEKHGLQITADGDAVFYKGVLSDGTSYHAGPGVVNGVEYERDHLPNPVGAVVELPRSQVDGDRGVACSKGLHVGDFTYPTQYLGSSAPRLLNVVVNPRDVVSVPLDENDRKVRVCRYVVASENPDKIKFEGVVVDPYETPVAPGVEVVIGEAGPEAILPLIIQRDIPADDDDEASATAPTIQIDTETQKVVTPVQGGSRVAEYEQVIRDLIKGDPNVSLRRYRSKKVTAARRAEFKQAAENLGFKL